MHPYPASKLVKKKTEKPEVSLLILRDAVQHMAPDVIPCQGIRSPWCLATSVTQVTMDMRMIVAAT